MSYSENSLQRKFTAANSQYNVNSLRQSVVKLKCLYPEVSYGELFHGEIFCGVLNDGVKY